MPNCSLLYLKQIIRPVTNPIKETGHIHILYENLAPEGSVAKIIGLYFSGPALVFEGEEPMIATITENPVTFKGRVVVIRGEGPKGGPAMPEMLTPTSAIMGARLGKALAVRGADFLQNYVEEQSSSISYESDQSST